MRLLRIPAKQEGILIELRTSQPTRRRSCLQSGVSGVQMHNKLPSQRKYGPIDPPRACIAAKYAVNLRELVVLQCVPQMQSAKDQGSTGFLWRGISCRKKTGLLTKSPGGTNRSRVKKYPRSRREPLDTGDAVLSVSCILSCRRLLFY